MPDPGYHWVPVEQVTTPPSHSHLWHVPDAWWVTNGAGEVLLYRGRDGHDSPMSNRSRTLVEGLMDKLKMYAEGATGVVHLEHAFLPDDPGRY